MTSEKRIEFRNWLNEQLSEHPDITTPGLEPVEEFLRNGTPPAHQPDEIYDETGRLIAFNGEERDASIWDNIRSYWNGMGDGEKLLAVGAGLFAVALVRSGKSVADAGFMIAGFPSDKKKDQIGISTRVGMKIVRPFEIIYLQAAKNNGTTIFLTDQRQLETCRRIGEIETSLSVYPEFLRVHRSYIVNTTFLSGYFKHDNLLELHKSLVNESTPKLGAAPGRQGSVYTVFVGSEYKSRLDQKLKEDLLFI